MRLISGPYARHKRYSSALNKSDLQNTASAFALIAGLMLPIFLPVSGPAFGQDGPPYVQDSLSKKHPPRPKKQSFAKTKQTTKAPIAPQDSEQVEFSADQLTYDAETGEVRALGRVSLNKDGYQLLAGEITYNEKTGQAEASGAVEFITPNGEHIFSPRLTLDEQLKTAFVEDFRLLLTDGSRAAAESGRHDENAGITILNRAAYSPCKICDNNPNSKPTWQIKAIKVTHDREKHRLYYRDAFLEVLGVPILWTPYFSHPDPTVEKASGFLPLDFKRRNELGLIVSAPYHYVIDDSEDLTVTPTLTTREGPVLSAEYRRHLGFGEYKLEGSATYANRLRFPRLDAQNPILPPDALITGNDEWRGHIKAAGHFDHTENWRSNFDLSWTSDDTYLRRYDFSDADTLVSDYKLEGFFGPSYVSARTLAFQGLRLEDQEGLAGFALPLIDAEYISAYKPLGGTISLKANSLVLQRFNGLDTQRASFSGEWSKRIITPKGFLLNLSGLARSDFYNITDIDQPDDPAFAGDRDHGERFLTRGTARLSWPLIKQGKHGAHTVEPILELTLSPARGAFQGLVNEDSRAFELNELNIFSSERAAGYDLWQEGSRLTYGLNWHYSSSDLTSDILLGQSLRFSGRTSQFPDGTGLEGDSSDFVGHTRVNYRGWFDIEHRFRLDDTDLQFRRNEINLRLGEKEAWGLLAQYFFLDRDLGVAERDIFINREDREEIRLNAFYQLDENWRLSAGTIQNLTSGRSTIEYGGEISYQDECVEFGLEIRESFTTDRDFNPGTQVIFRIKLRNLG